jgi:hypothetical protein
VLRSHPARETGEGRGAVETGITSIVPSDIAVLGKLSPHNGSSVKVIILRGETPAEAARFVVVWSIHEGRKDARLSYLFEYRIVDSM